MAGGQVTYMKEASGLGWYTLELKQGSVSPVACTGFCAVQRGGRDLSSEFTRDFLGTARTADGAGTGWSMGAYEQDN